MLGVRNPGEFRGASSRVGRGPPDSGGARGSVAGRGQGPPDSGGPRGSVAGMGQGPPSPGEFPRFRSRDGSGSPRYRAVPGGAGRWRYCAALRRPDRPRGRDGTNRLGRDEPGHGAIGNSRTVMEQAKPGHGSAGNS